MSQYPSDPSSQYDQYGQAPDGRQRSSGGFFPFPHRSWRTKRGTSVTVGGCCLPIPLGFAVLVAAGGAAAHHLMGGNLPV